MIVYRISKTKFIDDLSGFGSHLNGNRWNSKGVFMLYTSCSRALALLELLVHIDGNMVDEMNFSFAEIEIPDNSMDEIHLKQLGDEWRDASYGDKLRKKGDEWIRKSKSVALLVPSVIIAQECNVLINPHQADFKKIKLKNTYRFSFDHRLKQ